VRGLRLTDSRPVHPQGGPQPGVARSLPEVLRVQEVPRRELHLLRQGGQDLLQGRLPQVSEVHL
jgi:hypothetical protein